jgi:hypothetical protein
MTVPPQDSGAGTVWGAVELGPELPPVVFTSTERWHQDRIGALALYCSDGRWGDAFDEFCHKHLLIPRYDRWAVPGGPARLVPHGDDTEVDRKVREQIDFLVKAHELERIVLITHFGCAYYGHRLQRTPPECLPAQTEDVRTASALLREWYPDLRVDAFLAMRTGNWLSFHGLEL